jgi:hypothetical protein
MSDAGRKSHSKGNEHVGALARIRNGDGHHAADFAVRAGDDPLLASEMTRAMVGLFGIIGGRRHRVRLPAIGCFGLETEASLARS